MPNAKTHQSITQASSELRKTNLDTPIHFPQQKPFANDPKRYLPASFFPFRLTTHPFRNHEARRHCSSDAQSTDSRKYKRARRLMSMNISGRSARECLVMYEAWEESFLAALEEIPQASRIWPAVHRMGQFRRCSWDYAESDDVGGTFGHEPIIRDSLGINRHLA